MSPFVFELIDFLKRDAYKRMTTDGYDIRTDAELQTWLQMLDKAPLSQIVDRYQYIFSVRGPLQLEKKLQDAFPVQDFIVLELTRYYPRMYRGLPRLYQRDNPTQTRIKTDFLHLPSLKKCAVAKAVFSRYSSFPTKGKVLLITWVMNDGLGDMIAMREAEKIIKERLPDVSVQALQVRQEDFDFGNCPEVAWADFVLQMPTFHPKTAPHITSLGEYGFIESDRFHPRSGHFSMGLHFLEKGILIPRVHTATWADVKNRYLRSWRIASNLFFLAYLATPTGGQIYLHALLQFLRNDPKDIDLCVPDLGWFIKLLEIKGKTIIDGDYNLARIEIYWQEQKTLISIADQGKTLRILGTDSLEDSDFRALLYLSGPLVGIRGNQSFSQAIAMGKVFFYDARPHAANFMKDLLALAENRLQAFPSALIVVRAMFQAALHNFEIQQTAWVDDIHFREKIYWKTIVDDLATALQKSDCHDGFKALSKIIRTEHSANRFLCHMVQRGLSHKQSPELHVEETEQVEAFAHGKQTFMQLMHQLEELLS